MVDQIIEIADEINCLKSKMADAYRRMAKVYESNGHKFHCERCLYIASIIEVRKNDNMAEEQRLGLLGGEA